MSDNNKNSINEDNPFDVFLIKKTDKVVSAIYLVTNHIKDIEPLKFKIRKDALSLMRRCRTVVTIQGFERCKVLRLAHTMFLALHADLFVARTAGIISVANTQVITEEIDFLTHMLDRECAGKQSQNQFSFIQKSFFATDMADDTALRPKNKGTVSLTPRLSERAPLSHTGKEKRVPAREVIKDQIGAKSLGRNSRQDSIISFIRTHGEVSIKDVSDTIPDVSEKTIQRELLALVAAGVLEKHGQRRWSTYRIAR